MKRAWTWKNKCSYGNHTWVSLFWQWSHPPHGSSSPLTLSILLSFCSLPPRATLCLCLPQQAILGSTAPLVSKDPIPVHQHGRPYLLQLVPCVERGPPTLLGCCQSLQNTPFQCYIKHFKKNYKPSSPQRGSTNMPIFGRVHECKEYEHWSEKQVWVMSVTKWTLSKKKRDP